MDRPTDAHRMNRLRRSPAACHRAAKGEEHDGQFATSAPREWGRFQSARGFSPASSSTQLSTESNHAAATRESGGKSPRAFDPAEVRADCKGRVPTAPARLPHLTLGATATATSSATPASARSALLETPIGSCQPSTSPNPDGCLANEPHPPIPPIPCQANGQISTPPGPAASAPSPPRATPAGSGSPSTGPP